MASTYIKLPFEGGGGGGAVDSVNGQTGAVVITKSSIGLSQVSNTSDATKNAATATLQNKKIQLQDGSAAQPSLTFQSEVGLDTGIYTAGDGNLSIAIDGTHLVSFGASAVTIDGDLVANNFPPVGNFNGIAGYDADGDLTSIQNWNVNTSSGGLYQGVTKDVTDNSGQTFNQVDLNFNPTENSPGTLWVQESVNVNMDVDSSGFSQGTGGTAVIVKNVIMRHEGTGDIGRLTATNIVTDLGNGTDPIDVRGFSGVNLFGNIRSGVTVSEQPQGFGFQPNFEAGAVLTQNISAFYDRTNIADSAQGHESFAATPVINQINNNSNYTGLNIAPNIETFQGNAGFNGVAISPSVGTLNSGGLNGLSVNPQIDLNKNYVYGLNVNVGGVTNYAGVPGTVTVQDIQYTFRQAAGDNNNFSVEYVDAATAGSEMALLIGNVITLQIESGVSTAQQVVDALNNNLTLAGALLFPITGSASNPQVAQAATPFAGAEAPGVAKAAYFNGDVQIEGSLSFTGNLALGAVNSFGSLDLATAPAGVASVSQVITQPTLADNETLTGIDLLGVNTAMLLSVGANSHIATNFLGISALGLPAVVTLGAGSTIDRVSGAVFAISLDGTSGGGTINEVSLCRSLAIPNGITTVNALKGFEFSAPFGTVGTTSWGFYTADVNANNYFAKNLIIGGATGTPTNSDTALEIQSKKAIKFPSLTTTEKNALDPVAGMMVYDETLGQMSYYNGTWVNI
jgi:hypothetical protein